MKQLTSESANNRNILAGIRYENAKNMRTERKKGEAKVHKKCGQNGKTV